MANTCEPVQGSSQRTSQRCGRKAGSVKMADRLGPKWCRGQEPAFNVAALVVTDRTISTRERTVHAPRSICRCLRSRTPEVETSKARISASTGERPIFPPQFVRASSYGRGPGSFRLTRANRGKRSVSGAVGGAGVGCWRKRMPLVTERIRVRNLPGAKASKLPAGASLQESLENRLAEESNR